MPEVQWVASAGGSVWVRATTRSTVSPSMAGIREGRVLSRSRPSYPSCMEAACQRQTQVFDLPVRRMISLSDAVHAQQDDLGSPHVLVRRVAILCQGLEPAPASRLERKRNLPLRMRKTRMQTGSRESLWDSNVRCDPPEPASAAVATAACCLPECYRERRSTACLLQFDRESWQRAQLAASVTGRCGPASCLHLAADSAVLPSRSWLTVRRCRLPVRGCARGGWRYLPAEAWLAEGAGEDGVFVRRTNDRDE